MNKPPYPRKAVTQDFLDKAFAQDKWEEKLKNLHATEFYNRPTPPEAGQVLGTSTIGVRYCDQEKNLVAIVIYYRRPDGTLGASGRPSPKLLLIDGIVHYK